MGYAEIIVPKPCNSSEDGLYCRCTRNVITHQESECNEEMKTVMLNTTNDIVNGDVATVEQTKETKIRKKRGNPYLRGNTWSFDYCTCLLYTSPSPRD